MKIGQMRTDLALERDGVWCTYPGTDLRCRIARLNNQAYQQNRRRVMRDAKITAATEGTVSDVEMRRLLAPIVAEFVLLGWENLEDDNGPVLYSRTRATELLSDPSMHDFFDWVLRQAQDADLFMEREREEALGNS